MLLISTAQPVFPGTLSAPALEKTFSKANGLYEAKDYDEALREYQSILDSGLKGGNLYYNIGNAYIGKGALGKAILNYTRALRYMPNDSDVIANLWDAVDQMKQQPPVENRNFLFKWLDKKVEHLTLNKILFLMSFLYFILIGYVILTRVFAKYDNYSIYVTIFLSITLVLMIFPYTHRMKNLREGAITIVPIEDVKYEPKKGASTSFTLYEGMKVYIMRSQGDWHKVKRTDGKIGWVPKESVEFIGM